MRSIVMGLVICLGVAATASAQAAKVAAGEKLFISTKCTLCHSVGDVGNDKGPMEELLKPLKVAEIRAWITDPKGMAAKRVPPSTRKPAMTEFKLPKEDVDALVAYLMSVKNKKK